MCPVKSGDTGDASAPNIRLLVFLSMMRRRKEEPPLWLGGKEDLSGTGAKGVSHAHGVGAAAMMAVVITHPVDQTKIRSQVQRGSLSMIGTARQTIRISGILGLWQGLSGSLLRQATYGSARFGIYSELKRLDQKNHRKGNRFVNGAIAGVVSGVVGAPAELVMVRMSADGILPEASRSNYRNSIHGLYRIWQEKGLVGCFRGLQFTLARSVIMNAAQLSSYDVIKEQLLATGYFHDTAPLHLLTATLGGTIAVTACAPADVFKSRVQASTTSGKSASRMVADTLRKEGASVLFRGWAPAWWRMFPQTTLTFMFFEQLKKLYTAPAL